MDTYKRGSIQLIDIEKLISSKNVKQNNNEIAKFTNDWKENAK